MRLGGIGRVIFWGGGSLWIGLSIAGSDLHAHHAIQLCFGLDGPVQFRRDPRSHWTAYRGAVIRPGVPHEYQAPGRQVANILFEPETPLGRALLARIDDVPIAPIGDDVARRLAGPLARAYANGADDADLQTECLAVLSDLAGAATPHRIADRRILAAIDWINAHLDQPLGLAEVSSIAGLSEGRFRHLFVAETGIAFRPFVLWKRLNRALELGYGGTSWTEAAHAANFADSAHLTRTCRRMLGLVPSSIRIDATAQSDQLIA